MPIETMGDAAYKIVGAREEERPSSGGGGASEKLWLNMEKPHPSFHCSTWRFKGREA